MHAYVFVGHVCSYTKTACIHMYVKYLDISFELPLEEELQSSGGIEFNTGQSQIYIPYTAIQHQKNTEGQCKIYSYVCT